MAKRFQLREEVEVRQTKDLQPSQVQYVGLRGRIRELSAVAVRLTFPDGAVAWLPRTTVTRPKVALRDLAQQLQTAAPAAPAPTPRHYSRNQDQAAGTSVRYDAAPRTVVVQPAPLGAPTNVGAYVVYRSKRGFDCNCL